MKKTTQQRFVAALKIVGNVLLYVFFAICMFVLLITIFSKRNVDGAVNVFGYEMRIVVSASMEKHKDTDVSAYKIKDIPVKSAVFVELVPENEAKADAWYASLKVGDVLTFRYFMATRQETITHRIVQIEEKETGGYIIVLEGDNKSDNTGVMQQIIDTSEEDSPNYVLGKVVGKSYVLGLLVYTIKQPIGISLFIIIPCTIIIIFEIIRIINLFNGEKRRKVEEAAQEQQSKMEEQQSQMEILLRRIAELENGKMQNNAPPSEQTGPPMSAENAEFPTQAESAANFGQGEGAVNKPE